MPSETYRYYCLDSTGKLHSAEWFEADSDEDAVAQIEAKHPGGQCEIWQGKRLVASLSPTRATSSLSVLHLHNVAEANRADYLATFVGDLDTVIQN